MLRGGTFWGSTHSRPDGLLAVSRGKPYIHMLLRWNCIVIACLLLRIRRATCNSLVAGEMTELYFDDTRCDKREEEQVVSCHKDAYDYMLFMCLIMNFVKKSSTARAGWFWHIPADQSCQFDLVEDDCEVVSESHPCRREYFRLTSNVVIHVFVDVAEEACTDDADNTGSD